MTALAALLVVSLGGEAKAESLLVAKPAKLESLDEFRSTAGNWKVAGGLAGDPRREKTLQATSGTGLLVNAPTEAQHDSLLTTWEHGDLELDLDFLLPAESNSGVYLQGRYEVQLLDSWGVKTPKFGDCGGIYQQWDDAKPEGHRGSGGFAPKANASRAPGLWQHLHVEFRAPRFDATGKKIANARFMRVELNGFLIHENVEVPAVTRGAISPEEKPFGPLLIQGDHGAVALRNLAVKRFGAERVEVKELAVKFYEGWFWSPAEYEKKTPTREAAVAEFPHAITAADGRGAAVFTGTLQVPAEGEYAFEVRGVRAAYLSIDGRSVIQPNPAGRSLGHVTLKAGPHRFQLDEPQGSQRSLELFSMWCEGPGIAPQLLGASAEPKRVEDESTSPMPVEVTDRVLVQRTFTRFEGMKRIYTVAVGNPSMTHYAYDLESAALLRVWRGDFLDAAPMWSGRGYDQTGTPMGPALTLTGKPLLTLFADGETLWPTRPARTTKSKGFRTEPNGQPTFLYEYIGVSVEDRVVPQDDGRGLSRHLHVTGAPWERNLWMLVAEGSTISEQPGGQGYIVGDREFYVDWPADAPLKPMIRTAGGVSQLVVSLPADGAARDVNYNLVW